MHNDTATASIVGNPDFITGGNAYFTVSNDKGDHFTFRVSRRKNEDSSPYFVSVLKGPDNTANYKYMGLYRRQNNVLEIRGKSTFKSTDVEARTFQWALRVIAGDFKLPEGYRIQHAGKCCVCARMLTTPDSISKGIGPKCADAL
jgi:hypothetical protein